MPRSSEGNYTGKPLRESQKDCRQSSRQSQNAVYVLAEFALDIMKVLETFNNDNFKSEGMLRIGKLFPVATDRAFFHIPRLGSCSFAVDFLSPTNPPSSSRFQEFHMAK